MAVINFWFPKKFFEDDMVFQSVAANELKIHGCV
jgi:hypothetical protein